jgi:hypothetical protein
MIGDEREKLLGIKGCKSEYVSIWVISDLK